MQAEEKTTKTADIYILFKKFSLYPTIKKKKKTSSNKQPGNEAARITITIAMWEEVASLTRSHHIN